TTLKSISRPVDRRFTRPTSRLNSRPLPRDGATSAPSDFYNYLFWLNEMLHSRNECENSRLRPAKIVLQSFTAVQKKIHVNVHQFKNAAHQIKVKLTKSFSAGAKLLQTLSVHRVNVSITLYNDLKSRGGDISHRPWRTCLACFRVVDTTCQPNKMKKITALIKLRFELIL
ncbi:Inner kinetochore subunit CHL4, partial [Frankliniella fusca]